MRTSNDIKSLTTEFLRDFDEIADAKSYCTIHYIAHRINSQNSLVKCRIRMNNSVKVQEREFLTKNVLAGEFSLCDLGVSLSEIIQGIVFGELQTPNSKINFLSLGDSAEGTYFPLHPEGLEAANRLSVLILHGNHTSWENFQPSLDWELKGAAEPYDSLHDLMDDYHLGVITTNRATVEIIADNIVAIDPNSHIDGDTARIFVRIANGIEPSLVTIGYRLFLNGRVIERRSIYSSAIVWDNSDGAVTGLFEMQLPVGSVIHCYLRYKGTVRHQYWIRDQRTAPNHRRAVYEAFDPELAILNEFLHKSSARGRDARDLETGVAWQLWMLGFSVIHLGGTDKTRDAADLVATTPGGDYLVVECTTGLLKAENKLALLYERSTTVKRRLEASGSRHLRVLPVIITTKSRDEIEPDLDQAKKLGISVLAREDISESFVQTLFLPNPDKLYNEAFQEAIDKRREAIA